MTKSTLESSLRAAQTAIQAALSTAIASSEANVPGGTEVSIRTSGGTIFVGSNGKVNFLPDGAMPDNLRFSETRKSPSYVSGSAGSACSCCGGSGRA